MQTSILEKGIIYFFFRGWVGVEDSPVVNMLLKHTGMAARSLSKISLIKTWVKFVLEEQLCRKTDEARSKVAQIRG